MLFDQIYRNIYKTTFTDLITQKIHCTRIFLNIHARKDNHVCTGKSYIRNRDQNKNEKTTINTPLPPKKSHKKRMQWIRDNTFRLMFIKKADLSCRFEIRQSRYHDGTVRRLRHNPRTENRFYFSLYCSKQPRRQALRHTA